MGVVLAESDACEIVEGNRYIPPCTARVETPRPSDTHTFYPWKGAAFYYDVVVNGQINRNAAWYYAESKETTMRIQNHIAFRHGARSEP